MGTKMKKIIVAGAFLAAIFASSAGMATVLTFSDKTLYDAAAGSTITDTFDSSGASWVPHHPYLGSGFTITASDGYSLYEGQANQNGHPYSSDFMFYNNAGTAKFTFAEPVYSVGIDLMGFYLKGGSVTFASPVYTGIIQTLMSGQAQFFGLVSDTAFSVFCITIGYTNYGMFDNLSFSTASPVSQTPIPGALPLFASALGLGGLFAWKRKRQAAMATA